MGPPDVPHHHDSPAAATRHRGMPLQSYPAGGGGSHGSLPTVRAAGFFASSGQEVRAASNCFRTELLIRPRAGTSMPFAFAQARIVALSELTLVVLPPPRLRRA